MPRKRKAAQDPKKNLNAVSAWMKDLSNRVGVYDEHKVEQEYRRVIVGFYKRYVFPKGTILRSTMVKTSDGRSRLMLAAKLKSPWIFYDFTIPLE